MKWYTLEERPIKVGEVGLSSLGDNDFDLIIREKIDPPFYFGNLKSIYRNDFNESFYYQEDEIKYWIPIEELEASLPKD